MKLDTSHILTRSLLSVCYFYSALIEAMKTLTSICEPYVVLSGVNSEHIVTSSQIICTLCVNLGVHLVYVCALSSPAASTHGAKKEDRDSVIQLLEAEVPNSHHIH